MNNWENAVITSKGISLLTKIMAGETLKITRGVTGAGYVTPGTLQNQVAVSSPMQQVTFREITYPEEGKCSLACFITNNGISDAYTANQVGIYATDPDEGEILFFITQAIRGKGMDIPSETEMPGYSSEWTFYFKFGQASGVSIEVDPAHSVSFEEMGVYVRENSSPPQYVMILSYSGEEEKTVYSIDKSFDELEAAYAAGRQIRLVDINGMEFELLAFRANYMAYFAHQLDSARYLVCFQANGTVSFRTDVPYTDRNPPSAKDVGAKGSNKTALTQGSIKEWALAQPTSTSVGVYQQVTDLPEEGAYWIADLIVATNGLWRKLTVTKSNSNGSAPTTYECTCMSDTWSDWTKVYNDANKPTPSDIGMKTETLIFHYEDETTRTVEVYIK